MANRTPMSRAEAARLLGVDMSADPDTVRHAWRMWARVAHPDAGGDPSHFARLDRARRLLMQPQPQPQPVGECAPVSVPDRHRWVEVLQRPRHPVLVLLACAGAVALAALPGFVDASSSLAQLAPLALLASVAACVVAAVATREVLNDRADRGHRMGVITGLWAVLVGLQLAVAAGSGVSLVPVLPVMALPVVALVGVMNLGAGLWRPVQVGGSRSRSAS